MIGEKVSQMTLEDAVHMLDVIVGYSQIIIADLILSGDNALVIGMAAAGLAV